MTSKLNIVQMIEGAPIRLRYVYRFSTCRMNHRETVAEHSYYVGLYSMFLGSWYESNVPGAGPLRWKRLMTSSMIHDLEEGRSGDFPRYFKHSSDELKAMLDEAGERAFTQVVGDVVDPVEAGYLQAVWGDAKDRSIEGRIVALADFLSVLSIVQQEIKSGNRAAGEHVHDLQTYWESIRFDKSFKPFEPILQQLEDVMRGFCKRGFA